jgi:hypothetical protein
MRASDIENPNNIFASQTPLFTNPAGGFSLPGGAYTPPNIKAASRKIGSIHQIRDQQFYIEILLYNQLPNEEPLNVPFFFVDSLVINESIQSCFTTAEITFNTDFELLSRGSPNELTVGDKTIPKIKAPYIDRTDGRNRLSLQIVPLNNEDLDTYDENLWSMSFDFVVTDIQDLNVPNTQRKKRKYILVDERFQMLSEKNIEWSTREFVALQGNVDPFSLTDEQSATFPNMMLVYLLYLAGFNPTTQDFAKVGFDGYGTINAPNVPFFNIDSANWDTGADVNENKLLYHSPANSTALDDLYHVLSHCMGSDRGPVILDFGRSLSDKSWKLYNLTNLFENSSNNQTERLFIEDSLSPDNTTPPIPRAETDTNSSKNFTSSVASRIQRYKFVPMVAADDARILNSPLHYFDFQNSQWNIWFEENTAKKVEEQLSSYAKAGLYSHKSGINPHVLLNLNKTKTEGFMTKNEYSPTKFIAPNAPRNQMVLDALFLGQAISFQAMGLTVRTPGKFIFIDRVASGDSNPFDDRFLGQWFTTKVSHLFTQSSYITEVVATKIDTFSKIWPVEDSNY